MEKINITELLKNCPKSMELDCTICNGVKFIELDRNPNYPIVVRANNGYEFSLTKYGQVHNIDDAKCVIFPKGKTTWDGFHRPFKDGDIVRTKYHGIAILDNRIEEYSEGFRSYCGLFNYGLDVDIVVLPEHLATEEEKQKLFQAIKDNGYKWNPETKTLEKLIEQRFKVGDRIKLNDSTFIYTITDLLKDRYIATVDSYGLHEIEFERQDAYKLVPNKFDINTLKPFDKVLVRDFDNTPWEIEFFSRLLDGKHFRCLDLSYMQCIPYEPNKELLGTTDDCGEYFKTWK